MKAIHPDLAEVIDAAQILSPTCYRISGETRQVTAGFAVQNFPGCLPSLADELYFRLYTRPSPPPARRAGLLARRDHVAALSEVNNGRGCWEPGWTVTARDTGGSIAVTKNGLTVWAPPAGVRGCRRLPRPGDACRVRVPKELRNMQPGNYCAVGDADPAARPVRLVRLYWHLTALGAVDYIRAVTATLNARGVPFRTKVFSDPGSYTRADAGVLYVERASFTRLGRALQSIHRAVAPGLRPGTPLFTKPLAEGLGLAEDPPGHGSFGRHRCGLVARALWRSFLQRDRSAEARADTVAGVFREAGLDAARPYLGRHSRDTYGLAPATRPG